MKRLSATKLTQSLKYSTSNPFAVEDFALFYFMWGHLQPWVWTICM